MHGQLINKSKLNQKIQGSKKKIRVRVKEDIKTLSGIKCCKYLTYILNDLTDSFSTRNIVYYNNLTAQLLDRLKQIKQKYYDLDGNNDYFYYCLNLNGMESISNLI